MKFDREWGIFCEKCDISDIHLQESYRWRRAVSLLDTEIDRLRECLNGMLDRYHRFRETAAKSMARELLYDSPSLPNDSYKEHRTALRDIRKARYGLDTRLRARKVAELAATCCEKQALTCFIEAKHAWEAAVRPLIVMWDNSLPDLHVRCTLGNGEHYTKERRSHVCEDS